MGILNITEELNLVDKEISLHIVVKGTDKVTKEEKALFVSEFRNLVLLGLQQGLKKETLKTYIHRDGGVTIEVESWWDISE